MRTPGRRDVFAGVWCVLVASKPFTWCRVTWTVELLLGRGNERAAAAGAAVLVVAESAICLLALSGRGLAAAVTSCVLVGSAGAAWALRPEAFEGRDCGCAPWSMEGPVTHALFLSVLAASSLWMLVRELRVRAQPSPL